MATISPIQYQTTKHYPARVLHVSDHVQPGWRDSRNRVKLVFGVQMAHGREEAHIYLDCDEQWNLGADGREFLERLLPSSPNSLESAYLREVLAGAEVELAFGRATVIGQRQPVVDVRPAALDCPPPPQRNWNCCRIEVDLEKEEVRTADEGITRRRPLKGVPRMVQRLLIAFADIAECEDSLLFTADGYARHISNRNQDPHEVLRKAMGKLRRWLDQLDQRSKWGTNALVGKPRYGYRLRIQVWVTRQRADRNRRLSHDEDRDGKIKDKF